MNSMHSQLMNETNEENASESQMIIEQMEEPYVVQSRMPQVSPSKQISFMEKPVISRISQNMSQSSQGIIGSSCTPSGLLQRQSSTRHQVVPTYYMIYTMPSCFHHKAFSSRSRGVKNRFKTFGAPSYGDKDYPQPVTLYGRTCTREKILSASNSSPNLHFSNSYRCSPLSKSTRDKNWFKSFCVSSYWYKDSPQTRNPFYISSCSTKKIFCPSVSSPDIHLCNTYPSPQCFHHKSMSLSKSTTDKNWPETFGAPSYGDKDYPQPATIYDKTCSREKTFSSSVSSSNLQSCNSPRSTPASYSHCNFQQTHRKVQSERFPQANPILQRIPSSTISSRSSYQSGGQSCVCGRPTCPSFDANGYGKAKSNQLYVCLSFGVGSTSWKCFWSTFRPPMGNFRVTIVPKLKN